MWYWMTQSLLSDWQRGVERDDMGALLSALRREEKPSTKAMEEGRLFESCVTATSMGLTFEPVYPDSWYLPIQRFGRKVRGAQPQVPIWGTMRVMGMDLVLYGVCDFVQAGRIYDIKKTGYYSYGKYADSPQHPMYLYLLPQAKKFDYLIFDGERCYTETYRRGDYTPIETTIRTFLTYLQDTNTMDLYKAFWHQNAEREEKIHGIYQREE